MQMKNRMHPRNIYKNPPNFKELAVEYPEFRKYVKTDLTGKVTIDYQDQNAVKALTYTLLKKDFDLEVTINETRLIPRVPLNLNYILWIEDLLRTLQVQSQPLGIDIGTGSVCIYSLLAAKKGWKMLATEVDPDNFKLAEKNVSQNNLTDLISLKLVSDSNKLLCGVINENTVYDFCMCNPPFFNPNEKPQNRTSRRRQLETVPSEIPSEMSTEGGELSFISKLIKDSQQLSVQVKIYTTLVGKKSDFMYLKKEVQKVGPKSVAYTEFCQGRTIRWGLAWTFLEIDLRNNSSTELERPKKNKSKPLILVLPSSKTNSFELAFKELTNIFTQLKMNFKEESIGDVQTMHFKAYKNTWSHQRRKKRLQARSSELETPSSFSVPDDEEEECSTTKKLKLDKDSSNVEPFIVEGAVALKKIDSSVVFEFSYISGNKEALHQIFQYFKNIWSKEIQPDS